MKKFLVGYTGGQLKIQQMAFVLVAFVILLALVGVFFVSIKTSSLKSDAGTIREEQAQEMVRKLAGTGEFAWTQDDCASCVDLDKLMALKNRSSYEHLWGDSFALLRIKRIYPLPTMQEKVECTLGNYPACTEVTLLDRNKEYTSQEAFVALCHFEPQGYTKCELGRIVLGVSG